MNMKFRIQTPEQSYRVQMVLLNMGYSWLSGDRMIKNTETRFLFAGNHITCDDHEEHFRKHPNKEIDVSWMSGIEETVSIGGKVYRLADIERLKPIG